MDVINFISKHPELPDGPLTASGYGDGMPYFSYGPRIHTYLAEMRQRVFASRPGTYLTVGEMPGVTPERAREFTDAQHGQLDMVFQFEHVSLDHDGDKWTTKPIRVDDLRETLGRWQVALGDAGWNSLYWNNHDQPRVVSRFGDDGRFWFESATALAIVLHLHRGTPYIYQGEEIGMTNATFADIADFRDIESLQYYAHTVDLGHGDPAETLRTLQRNSRDNARTPMQWNGDRGAGFTSGTPWIGVNPNHRWLNAALQREDPGSIYHLYRRLIALRHSEPILRRGDFALLDVDNEDVYAFRRRLGSTELRVVANLSGTAGTFDHTDLDLDQMILGNYDASTRVIDHLAPWEARVHLWER
jgi:oligo-1,6-glucosidase